MDITIIYYASHNVTKMGYKFINYIAVSWWYTQVFALVGAWKGLDQMMIGEPE